MRWLLRFALALLLSVSAHAQDSNQWVQLSSGAPPTPCRQRGLAIDTTNNGFYFCGGDAAYHFSGGSGGTVSFNQAANFGFGSSGTRFTDNSSAGAFFSLNSPSGGSYSPQFPLYYFGVTGFSIQGGGNSGTYHELFLNERADNTEMGRIRCNANGNANGGTVLPCFFEMNQTTPSTTPYVGSTLFPSTVVAGKFAVGANNAVNWNFAGTDTTPGNDNQANTEYPLVEFEPVLHTPPTANHLATFNHNGCDTTTITGCTSLQLLSIQDSVTSAATAIGFNFQCTTCEGANINSGTPALGSNTVTNNLQIGGEINSGTNVAGSTTFIGPNVGTGNTNPFDTIFTGSATTKASGATAQVNIQQLVVRRYKNPGTGASPISVNLFTIPVVANNTAQIHITYSAEMHWSTPHNCSTSEDFWITIQNTAGTITSNTANTTAATICDTGTLTLAFTVGSTTPVQVSATLTYATASPTASAAYFTIENHSQSDMTLQ